MSWIYSLPSIPQDKANHFAYGAAIALLSTAAAAALGLPGVPLPCVGVAIAALAGAVKEGVDWLGNRAEKRAGLMQTHGVEFLDFLATAAGGAVVSAATFIGGL